MAKLRKTLEDGFRNPERELWNRRLGMAALFMWLFAAVCAQLSGSAGPWR